MLLCQLLSSPLLMWQSSMVDMFALYPSCSPIPSHLCPSRNHSLLPVSSFSIAAVEAPLRHCSCNSSLEQHPPKGAHGGGRLHPRAAEEERRSSTAYSAGLGGGGGGVAGTADDEELPCDLMHLSMVLSSRSRVSPTVRQMRDGGAALRHGGECKNNSGGSCFGKCVSCA
uniref:Uncharacterized protein n=1 Tax=Setaria italica TaxID=4555 RepID=K3XZM4_SETIT